MRKLFVFTCLLAVLLPATAQAAGKGIGLTPALRELVLEADQSSVSFKLSLVNSSDTPATLTISALDFGALDESGGIAFLGRTSQESAYGLSKWLNFDKTEVTLGPGGSEEVAATVTNQSSLRPGGHYGAVVVSQTSGGTGTDVTVVPSASTLVLLRKNGGEELKLELDEVKANSSLVTVPKSAQLKFKNSGNTHVVPRGTVELTNPSGHVVARAVINESSSFVLPESTRAFNLQLSNFRQPWLPGRYKLTTNWRWDGKEAFEKHETYHWYMGKLLLYMLLSISLLIVLIMYIKYRRRPPTRY